jgi:hypothetical protein
MKTLPAEEMMPTLPVARHININFRILENQGSARSIGAKVMPRGQYPYVLWLVVSVLSFSVFAQATMGAVVLTSNAVVIGMDSQISGKNVQLGCKLRHGTNMAILASGSYTFVDGLGKYDFWAEAERVLAPSKSVVVTQSASIKDTAAALDAKIRPLLIAGLTALYSTHRPYYMWRYGTGEGVLEFVVTGVDKEGPAVYRYWYVAKTPSDFKGTGPERLGAAEVGDISVVPIPMLDAYSMMGPTFWTIKPGEGEIAVSDKIVQFIHAVKDKGKPGSFAKDKGRSEISDPIATAVITSKGFSFLNKGKCARERPRHGRVR